MNVFLYIVSVRVFEMVFGLFLVMFYMMLNVFRFVMIESLMIMVVSGCSMGYRMLEKRCILLVLLMCVVLSGFLGMVCRLIVNSRVFMLMFCYDDVMIMMIVFSGVFSSY